LPPSRVKIICLTVWQVDESRLSWNYLRISFGRIYVRYTRLSDNKYHRYFYLLGQRQHASYLQHRFSERLVCILAVSLYQTLT
jgi:hypothetical protein